MKVSSNKWAQPKPLDLRNEFRIWDRKARMPYTQSFPIVHVHRSGGTCVRQLPLLDLFKCPSRHQLGSLKRSCDQCGHENVAFFSTSVAKTLSKDTEKWCWWHPVHHPRKSCQYKSRKTGRVDGHVRCYWVPAFVRVVVVIRCTILGLLLRDCAPAKSLVATEHSMIRTKHVHYEKHVEQPSQLQYHTSRLNQVLISQSLAPMHLTLWGRRDKTDYWSVSCLTYEILNDLRMLSAKVRSCPILDSPPAVEARKAFEY